MYQWCGSYISSHFYYHAFLLHWTVQMLWLYILPKKTDNTGNIYKTRYSKAWLCGILHFTWISTTEKARSIFPNKIRSYTTFKTLLNAPVYDIQMILNLILTKEEHLTSETNGETRHNWWHTDLGTWRSWYIHTTLFHFIFTATFRKNLLSEQFITHITRIWTQTLHIHSCFSKVHL